MRRKPTLTIPDLERLLAQTRTRLATLQKQRGKVATQLAEIDREIEALAPNGVSRGRKIKLKISSARGKRKTLKAAVYEALGAATEPLDMSGLEAGVRAAGYKTKSKNLVPMLRKSVYGDSKIARAGRGLYTLATETVAKQAKTMRRKRRSKAAKKAEAKS